MRLRFCSLVLVLALAPGIAPAQTPPATGVPAPAPVQSAPLSPPPAAQPSVPAQPPAAAQPAVPSPSLATGRATLFPNPGDQTDVDEGVLPAKPAAILNGASNWDDAFNNLKDAFARIEGELKKAGIAPTGRPLTLFVFTDDNGFRYEAMVPIAQAPEGRGELTPEIRFGKTPEGKSFRFVHKDAYDEIDGTYETITAYLDAKSIEAQEAFMEEYVSDFTDAQDTNFEVNIYVQPKG